MIMKTLTTTTTSSRLRKGEQKKDLERGIRFDEILGSS